MVGPGVDLTVDGPTRGGVAIDVVLQILQELPTRTLWCQKKFDHFFRALASHAM